MQQSEIYKCLFLACEKDDIQTFNALLPDDANLEYRNDKGWTMLIVAAFNHSYKIVDSLIRLGADINATNSKGTTVLMYAKTKVLDNRNFDFLDMLIAKGADTNKKDIYGKNILDYVVALNSQTLINYFKPKVK